MRILILTFILVSGIATGAEVEFEERFLVEQPSYTVEGLKQFLTRLGLEWSLHKTEDGVLVPMFCMSKHIKEDMCTLLPPELLKQLFDYISSQVHI